MSSSKKKETSETTQKTKNLPSKALTVTQELPDDPQEQLAAYRTELERAQAKIAALESQEQTGTGGHQAKEAQRQKSRLQQIRREFRGCKNEVERLQGALKASSAELQRSQQQLKRIKEAHSLLKKQVATQASLSGESGTLEAREKTPPEAEQVREAPLPAEANPPAFPSPPEKVDIPRVSGSHPPSAARLTAISSETQQPATILYHDQSFQLQVSFANGTENFQAWENFQYQATVYARSLAGGSQEILRTTKHTVQTDERIDIYIKANTLLPGDYRLLAMINLFAPEGNTVPLTAESSLIHIH